MIVLYVCAIHTATSFGNALPSPPAPRRTVFQAQYLPSIESANITQDIFGSMLSRRDEMNDSNNAGPSPFSALKYRAVLKTGPWDGGRGGGVLKEHNGMGPKLAVEELLRVQHFCMILLCDMGLFGGRR